MKLKIVRQLKTDLSSVGQWFINNVFIKLYSLEDEDRNLKQSDTLAKIAKVKVKGETAIPITDLGEYEVIIDRSERFSKQYGIDMYMLHIMNVPGFDGIRIHWGNTDVDTDGCPLVGMSGVKNAIGASRIGYKKLLQLLAPVMGFTVGMHGTLPIIIPIDGFVQKEKVTIEIITNY